MAVSRDPRSGVAGVAVWWERGAADPEASVHALAAAVADADPTASPATDRSIRVGTPGEVLGEHEALAHELTQTAMAAESELGDMAEIEVTITAGRLEVTAMRCARRSAVAMLRVAVDLHDEGVLDVAAALGTVSAQAVGAFGLARSAGGDGALVATGSGASPGVAVGEVQMDLDGLLDAVDEGRPVIFAAEQTSPADEPAMRVADGVLTTRGGVTSHAAVVARGWGLPAVCGAHELSVGPDGLRLSDGSVIVAGSVITLDGSTGTVHLGAHTTSSTDAPPELGRVLGWASDLVDGRCAVLANADDAASAQLARANGATGIGLCRTEHQFLGDRLELVRAAILAEDDSAEQEALEALSEAQLVDHVGVLAEMDELPVTIRLLDAPLHEFLPPIEELVIHEATGALARGEMTMLAAARRWHEHNPMLGTRGVRLAVVRPALYRAQTVAVARAVEAHRRAGGTPIVRLMVPLVATAEEFTLVASWLRGAYADVAGAQAGEELAVGAMVETPRAALCAGELARVADFLSIGTNDLTQLTFGFSRDDLHTLIPRYREAGLLDADPFVVLDPAGVGALIEHAVRAARAVRPTLAIGACGEHAGDPGSIEMLVRAGVDSISCSPYRVPTALVAAAQAVSR